MTNLLKRAQHVAAERLRAGIGAASFRPDHSGYTRLVEQNLIRGVQTDDFWADLVGGGGSELTDGPAAPAKFCAAHSSAALAVNTFGPFRRQPRQLIIADAHGFREARFEVKLPTGLGGEPPNIDFLAIGNPCTVCVESKFLEPLSTKTAKFAASYDRAISSLADESWTQVFRMLKANPREYGHLDAAQLVKHYLGMRNILRTDDRDSILMYVYWEPENCAELMEYRQHQAEINHFAGLVEPSAVRFRAYSYPQLWNEWEKQLKWDGASDHLEALRSRYSFAI